MKAHVITQFGAPSVFQTVELPKPTLKPGHVLVRVQASSVNPIDCKIRAGLAAQISPDFPAILHGDVCRHSRRSRRWRHRLQTRR